MSVKPKQMGRTATRSEIRNKFIGIIVLAIFCVLVVWPTGVNKGISWVNTKAGIGVPLLPTKNFNLGLDLQGGAHLIYQTNTSQIEDKDKAGAVEGVRDVIERRVRGGLGVAEPLVATTRVGNDYRIIVELPGVTDVNQAIAMIGETPVLEFKEQNNEPPRELTAAEKKQLDTFNAAAEKKAKEAQAALYRGVKFEQVVATYSEDTKTKATGGDLGFVAQSVYPELYAWARDHKNGEVSRTLIKSFNGLNIVKRIAERSVTSTVNVSATSTMEVATTEYQIARIFIQTKQKADFVPPQDAWKNSGLSGKQLKRAAVTEDTRTGQVQVSLQFDDEGTKLFADITSRNVGKEVAIVLDGTILTHPRVNEPITSGSAVISGGFGFAEARLLAQRFNSGALPVPVELLSQQKIDATLGADSLQKSFRAGLAGLLLVMIFMVIYYRLPGLLSVISLMVYAVVTLSIFKLLGVTLTLSGIAGFILSIGMAVDANVLVFERLKEELRYGKRLHSAMEEAFLRAWPSIRDGHVTTLISSVVLVWFGTGFIQGFAVVLGTGVLVSLFTAITVTRTIMRLVFGWFKKDESTILFLGHQNKKE